MLLSDRSIKQGQKEEWIKIEPFRPEYVQPASYDVHLSNELLLPVEREKATWWQRMLGIEPKYQPYCVDPLISEQPMRSVKLFTREQETATGEYFYLEPGGVALGATLESIQLYPDAKVAADIAGCSSLGRWFLFVHVTAGFIDPGWLLAPLTLELYNASPWYIRLWAGMRIGQLRFYDIDLLPERTYDKVGHYGRTNGVEMSRYTT